MRKTLLACAVAATVLVPLSALAGPYADFEGQLRDAYSDYRVALFQSNAGHSAATDQALESFSEKWDVLSDAWSDDPPPQYSDDPQFDATIKSVGKIVSDAEMQLQDGDLARTHVILEAIRDELGALHLRNGLMRFSDRMNAYHAKLEEVLQAKFAGQADGGLERMREDAAVLAYLARDIADHPAPESADPTYGPLVKALTKSVADFQSAARDGDLAAALAARKALKPAYAQLFLHFG